MASILARMGGIIFSITDYDTIALAYQYEPIVVFDMPRASNYSDIYPVLEAILNGTLTVRKYYSTTKTFNTPHVIVFTNGGADKEALSADRWEFYEEVSIDRAEDMEWVDNFYDLDGNNLQDDGLSFSGRAIPLSDGDEEGTQESGGRLERTEPSHQSITATITSGLGAAEEPINGGLGIGTRRPDTPRPTGPVGMTEQEFEQLEHMYLDEYNATSDQSEPEEEDLPARKKPKPLSAAAKALLDLECEDD
jgi:hypothetical protein